MEPKSNRLPTAVCILLVSITATCNRPPPRPADVGYSDGGRLSPAVRVSYEFAPGNDQRRRGSLVELLTGSSETIESAEEEGSPDSSRPLAQPSAAFDVDFASMKSRGTDRALTGRFAVLDDIQFTGPTTVRAKAKEHRGQISIRTGVHLDDLLSLEALPDLCFAHRDLWRQVEIISNLDITKNLALFTGYRWTWYDEKAFAGGSDVEFRAEGPTAGINLHF